MGKKPSKITKITKMFSLCVVTLLSFSTAGCEGLQLNLPVTVESSAPTIKGELWIFKDDIPTSINMRGSTGWHQEPICGGCSIILGAWFIEKGSSNPRPVKATWVIKKGDMNVININPLEDGHKVIITGLRPGKVDDLLVRSEEGHQFHLFDITVK